jgi:hypothetical protein
MGTGLESCRYFPFLQFVIPYGLLPMTNLLYVIYDKNRSFEAVTLLVWRWCLAAIS